MDEIMKESVIYQSLKEDIERKAKEEGKLEAKEEDRIDLADTFLSLAKERLGNINPNLEKSIQDLSFSQLKDFGRVLFNSNNEEDLVNWLSNLK